MWKRRNNNQAVSGRAVIYPLIYLKGFILIFLTIAAFKVVERQGLSMYDYLFIAAGILFILIGLAFIGRGLKDDFQQMFHNGTTGSHFLNHYVL